MYDETYENESFFNLSKIGDEGEEIANLYITNVLKENIISFNKDKYYDIRTHNNLYEIKFDRKAQETNNLFIEYTTKYFNNKTEMSGINITKANYYIFVIPTNINNVFNIIKIKTIDLLDIILNSKFKMATHYNKYYKSISTGWLIPIETIINICEISLFTLKNI